MKSAFKLFVAIFFILGVIKALEAQETCTISGKVRYADNNEVVTAGVVKIFNSSGILEAVAPINAQGDYLLGVIRQCGQYNVIGIADDEWGDFVPTGYPSAVNPLEFIQIVLTENLIGIDIHVQRSVGHLRPGATTTINGTVLSNNVPVKDAIVYAMQGNEYVGFGISDAKGQYSIKNIPVGDYILVAHKIASTSDSKQVTVSEKSNNNFSFSLSSRTAGVTNSTPYEFALVQNYPNPFNPSTVISYSVANSGPVTLKVFNNIGQQVAELVNTTQAAGIYNVEFNASTLSSGIYFYRLDAGSFSATKKMILVK